LRAVGARRIAIASPYPERHNVTMTAYLTAHGFDVVRAEGMDVAFKEMQNVPLDAIASFACNVLANAGDCDALYLPCPQWQAAQVVERIETESNRPAIAYTHANFFAAFRALGLKDAIQGHGRLLALLKETRQ
jgi:maleate cis-trans isomerase